MKLGHSTRSCTTPWMDVTSEYQGKRKMAAVNNASQTNHLVFQNYPTPPGKDKKVENNII